MHLEDACAGTPEPDLLPLLRAMRQVTYAGMPLATELEDWAVSDGIPLTVSWTHQTWRVDADGKFRKFSDAQNAVRTSLLSRRHS